MNSPKNFQKHAFIKEIPISRSSFYRMTNIANLQKSLVRDGVDLLGLVVLEGNGVGLTGLSRDTLKEDLFYISKSNLHK